VSPVARQLAPPRSNSTPGQGYGGRYRAGFPGVPTPRDYPRGPLGGRYGGENRPNPARIGQNPGYWQYPGGPSHKYPADPAHTTRARNVTTSSTRIRYRSRLVR